MSIADYRSWVQEAWTRSERDFMSGKYSPQDESDIQGHLYHCMFQTKERFAPANDILLTLEWRDVDVAVVQDSSRGQEPYLLIELKETHYADGPPRASRERVRKWLMRDKKVQADLWKLKELVRTHKLAIPVMTFFFRGAPRMGLGRDIMQLCSELTSEIASNDNVIFLFGPRPNE
jgi:hypothetical protein